MSSHQAAAGEIYLAARPYMIAARRPVEVGHHTALEPLLALDLRTPR